MAHTCNLSIREGGISRRLSELEARLVYRVRSRIDRAVTWRGESYLEKQTNKKRTFNKLNNKTE